MTARKLLILGPAGAADLESLELTNSALHVHASLHVDGCRECQAAVQAVQEFDRELTLAMRDVELPGRLRQKLRVALSISSTEIASFNVVECVGGQPATASIPVVSAMPTLPALAAQQSPQAAPVTVQAKGTRNPQKWLVRSLATTACLLLGIGIWSALRTSAVPLVSSNSILAEVAKPDFSLEIHPQFTGSLEGWLPAEIDRTSVNLLSRAPAHLLQTAAEVPEVIAIAFPIPIRHKVPLAALLVILRKSNVSDAALLSTSFAKAPTQYLDDGDATRTWQEGEFVYICLVRKKGADGLELLEPRSNAA